MGIPLILDCDPGHDDVFAIWLAAANPAIDLRAITAVGGNGRLNFTALNARVACTVAGITDVPIAAGAADPLLGTLHPADWIHGDNALGGPELPEPTVPLDSRSAQQLMADVVAASDEPVTIVATGPLTNVALFAKSHPELFKQVKEVVWMGGSPGHGNVTPLAEFNSWVDPEAVAIVLEKAADFTMVGLNISHQALITQEVRQRIKGIGNRTGQFGYELLEFFCGSYAKSEGMPDGPLHDPITVALLADPASVVSVRRHLEVELTGHATRGATSVDLHDFLKREPNANIAVELDVDRFWNLITDAISQLA